MKISWLAVMALALAACGPTERELGVAVLAATPAILVAGCLLQLLYRLAWRAVDGELPRFDLRPTAALFGLTLGCALLWARDLDDDALMAFALAGTSYATFLVVAMRATIRSTLYSWATVVPWILFAPLAVVLAAVGSTTSEADLSLAYYLLPGYGGLISGGLFALLLVEVLVRWYLKRQRAREAEPVFPEARVHND